MRESDAAIEAAASEAGTVLVFAGPPGIGKTSLLDEVARRAEVRGMRLLAARGSELEREFPFGVARQLFEHALAGTEESERQRLLDGPARAAGELVLGEPRSPARAVPEEVLFTAMDAMYWLVMGLSETKPLALVLDDAHWADSPSLRLLSYLTRRIEHAPVLLALAARPAEAGTEEELVQAILEDASAMTLRPAPLSAAATGEMAAQVLGGDPDPHFTEACHATTGGNPFLLRELLRTLAIEDVRPSAGGAEAVAEMGPAAVARAVLVRIARLRSECGDLARAVAVLGEPAELQSAAALAGIDLEHAAAAVDALAGAEVLRGEAPLGFVHPIIRRAIYDDIGPVERAGLHLEAARWLHEAGGEPERIGVHLLGTEPTGEDWAVDVLRAAGRSALDRGAAKSALAFGERALREDSNQPDQPAVLELVGVAAASAGDSSAADRLGAALQAQTDPLRRPAMLYTVGQVHANRGQLAEAKDAWDRARLEAEASAPDLAWTFEAAGATAGSYRVSTRDEALRRYRSLVQREDLDATPVGRLLLTFARGFEPVFAGRPRDEAVAAAIRASATPPSDDPTDYHAHINAAMVLSYCDQPSRALEMLSSLLAAAREHGYAPVAAHASWVLAWAHFLCGDVTATIPHAEAAVEGIDYGFGILAPGCHAVLAEALIEQGELERASAAAHGLRDERRWRDHIAYPYLVEARARLASERNELASVHEGFVEAGRLWRELGIVCSPSLTPWRSGAAAVAARMGDQDEARSLLKEELDVRRRFGAPRAVGIALRVSASVEGEEAGIELLGESVETLSKSEDRLEHARSLVQLGAELRRQGRRGDAREPLNEGLALARRCGAVTLTERAFEELEAAGTRPRRIIRTGVEELTPSELRICEMAADGASNKEIAQSLFVTVKTVETHLGHAYKKLDISSRGRLADALSGG